MKQLLTVLICALDSHSTDKIHTDGTH